MANSKPLVIRFSKPDKEALVELSNYLQRTQADAVRVILRAAYSQMKEQAQGVVNKTNSKPAS